MIEPDIVVDKRGPLEFQGLLNRIKCDWVFKDHGIEIVKTIEEKTVQMDGDVNRDGRHVQEGLGRQPKREGLIYSGNNPERIMPNLLIKVCSTAVWKKQLQKEVK